MDLCPWDRVLNVWLNCYQWWMIGLTHYLTVVIFLDYWKAFDSVPHTRLLVKLWVHGIHRRLLTWIKWSEATSNIKWFCGFLECDAESYPLGICVRLLYIIYVNDFPVHVDNHIKLFADDNKLYARIADLNDCHFLQSDLNNHKLCQTGGKFLLTPPSVSLCTLADPILILSINLIMKP